MALKQRAATAGIAALVLACAGLLWVSWSASGPEKPPAPEEGEESAEEVDPFADAALTGRVLEPDGEPVSGATVVARGKGAGADRSAVTVRTDDKGRYGFLDLEPGEWLIDASAEGLMSPGPELLRALRVVTDEETVLEADLRLRRPAQVSGAVVAGGQGLTGLPIDVRYSACHGLSGKLAPFITRRAAETGPGGRFSLPVAPCSFTLVVRDRKRGTRQSPPLTLADGARRTGLRIDFAPGGRIEGLVQAGNGRSVVATLTLTGKGLSKERTTDRSGNYAFRDVPAGRYKLTAASKGFQPTTVELVVKTDAVTAHDFTLQEQRGLAGKVQGPDGKPVAGARVVVRWGAGEAVVIADAGGNFTWQRDDVPSVTVQCQALTPRHAPSPWTSPDPQARILLRLGKGGFVTGVVVDRDGQPVVPAAVAVAEADLGDPNPFSARAFPPTRVGDPQGHFKLGPLAPGRYTLRGESQRHGPGVVRDVLVSRDHTTEQVEIRLTRGARLHGQITDAQGAAISGARVILHVPGTVMPPRVSVSDATGNYALEGLPAGRFSLRVRERGYLTALSSGVEIHEGDDLERNVVLRKAKKGERFAFQGIGATLTRRRDGIAVGALIAGGPAGAAGLKRGDVIRTVDGRATKGKGIRHVVEWIRGEPGSTVELDIVRGGQPMRIRIERGDVVIKGNPGQPQRGR